MKMSFVKKAQQFVFGTTKDMPGAARDQALANGKSALDSDSKHSDEQTASNFINIVCISDTHNGHKVPEFDKKMRQIQGDILIHAGDFGEHGTPDEVKSAIGWLNSLDNFKYKVFIAGNMDGIGLDEQHNQRAEQIRRLLPKDDPNFIYLENSACEVLGVNIYGCPYTPRFFGGFQYDQKANYARDLWKKIPENCDILISHGPPAGIFDTNSRGKQVGCEDLRKAIESRSLLKAIVFGHVHHSYGAKRIGNQWFINAAQYNGIYQKAASNLPYKIQMRKDDKSILHVGRIPMTKDEEKRKSNDCLDQTEMTSQ